VRFINHLNVDIDLIDEHGSRLAMLPGIGADVLDYVHTATEFTPDSGAIHIDTHIEVKVNLPDPQHGVIHVVPRSDFEPLTTLGRTDVACGITSGNMRSGSGAIAVKAMQMADGEEVTFTRGKTIHVSPQTKAADAEHETEATPAYA
jgi:hypothetical protein